MKILFSDERVLITFRYFRFMLFAHLTFFSYQCNEKNPRLPKDWYMIFTTFCSPVTCVDKSDDALYKIIIFMYKNK